MSSPLVTADDLGTYLGQPNIDQDRAWLVLTQAQALCEAILSPLPAAASAVILDVATRAFANPTNAASSVVGPGSAQFGAVAGGLWLTSQNKATLRVLAGGGGAFTIDMMPETAGQNLPWWDYGYGFDGFAS